jgi:hypothetical protein
MKTTKTNTNEAALARFMEIVGEIETTLEAIQEANSEHYDLAPEQIHWGHVGDVGRTLADLKNVLAVIRGDVK